MPLSDPVDMLFPQGRRVIGPHEGLGTVFGTGSLRGHHVVYVEWDKPFADIPARRGAVIPSHLRSLADTSWD